MLFGTRWAEKASGVEVFCRELNDLKERGFMAFRSKEFQGEDQQRNSGEYSYSRGIYSSRMVKKARLARENPPGGNAG